ncbi:HNH endonuclease [Roseiflexus sp.]|uniref:HNH endonuclease n=1 Tax=Roseiflexus sp. TaxID=2562120 RepID=UPI0021DD8E39|nr:HNH endonuclease [Roseiflexus sp.]GIV98814.1 MAG: hypothetical protein KatS3mg058_0218 [Roseiflexus sp.]
MTREIVSESLKQQIFELYGSRCYACGFSIHTILRVHHRIPVSLGGTDEIENLVLVCPNCHTLIHLFSSQRFDGREVSGFLRAEYSQEAIERIAKLSHVIRQAKRRIKQNANVWSADSPNSRRPYSVKEAIELVAQRNKYSEEKQEQLREVFQLTFSHIPQELRARCSYRLLKRASYISINLMNYLLYRSPGYGDLGGNPTYDCFLIFTNDIKDHFNAFDERNVFNFSYFDCVNLGLSFDEVLALTDAEWASFSRACQMAAEARKSRNWVSNIQVPQ